MYRVLVCLALSGVLAAQQPTTPETLKVPEGWTPLVRAELVSDLVVRGRLRITDTIAFDAAMQRGGGYAPISIEVTERIEGRCDKNIEFTCFVAPSVAANGIHPTGEELLDLDRREVILLLERVGRRLFLSDRILGETLMVASVDNLRRVHEVVERNDRLAKTPIPEDVAMIDDVLDILDEMAATPASQQEGLWKLQELGPLALPAIVRCLEDDRPIEAESIEIRARGASNGTGVTRITVGTFGEALGRIATEWANDSFGIARDSLDRRNRARRNECLRVFAHYMLADHRTSLATARKPRGH